jgi:hypothetical protein
VSAARDERHRGGDDGAGGDAACWAHLFQDEQDPSAAPSPIDNAESS